VWFPLIGTVGLWMVHLVGSAALTRATCNAPNREWMLHALTAVTAVPTAIGIVLAWRLLAANRDDDSADSDAGRRRFLGVLGVIVAAANLLLILAEEGMVLGFLHHRCG
jgi:hypothetical protein